MKIIRCTFYRIHEMAYMQREDQVTAPRDMLRYDLAFECIDDPGLLAFPTFKTKTGQLGGQVTRARWSSFGVRELESPSSRPLFYADLLLAPDRWLTFRHPRMPDGRIAYDRLVAVPLSAFVDPKVKEVRDLDDLAKIER